MSSAVGTYYRDSGWAEPMSIFPSIQRDLRVRVLTHSARTHREAAAPWPCLTRWPRTSATATGTHMARSATRHHRRERAEGITWCRSSPAPGVGEEHARGRTYVGQPPHSPGPDPRSLTRTCAHARPACLPACLYTTHARSR